MARRFSLATLFLVAFAAPGNAQGLSREERFQLAVQLLKTAEAQVATARSLSANADSTNAKTAAASITFAREAAEKAVSSTGRDVHVNAKTAAFMAQFGSMFAHAAYLDTSGTAAAVYWFAAAVNAYCAAYQLDHSLGKDLPF